MRLNQRHLMECHCFRKIEFISGKLLLVLEWRLILEDLVGTLRASAEWRRRAKSWNELRHLNVR